MVGVVMSADIIVSGNSVKSLVRLLRSKTKEERLRTSVEFSLLIFDLLSLFFAESSLFPSLICTL